MLKFNFSLFGKVFLSLVTFVSLSILSISSVHAVSIGPTDFHFTLDPGTSEEIAINIGNTETTPKVLTAEIKDFTYDAEKKITRYPEEGSPYGLTDWITFEKNNIPADPDESFEFNFTVQVPEDADPGLYQSVIIARAVSPQLTDGSAEGLQVGVSASAISKVYVIVPGEYEQSLEIENFNLNSEELREGHLQFSADVKNTGTVFLVPIGEITLVDANDNLVPGILTVKKTFEGQEVVVERKDIIPFNKFSKELLPGQSFTFTSKSEDVNLEPGSYKAKLVAYFGPDSEKIEAEIPFFDVGERTFTTSSIKLESKESFYFSGPAAFSLTVEPGEDIEDISSGNVEIKNIFGATKSIIDIDVQDLKDNLRADVVWDNAFGLGSYTAKLTVNTGDTVQTDSVSFWFITWWLLIVIALILLAILYGIIKYMAMYSKLKSKAEEDAKT